MNLHMMMQKSQSFSLLISKHLFPRVESGWGKPLSGCAGILFMY